MNGDNRSQTGIFVVTEYDLFVFGFTKGLEEFHADYSAVFIDQ